MSDFELLISGDFSDTSGCPVGDIALDLLDPAPNIHWKFIADHQPQANDPHYQDRLYSLEVTPEHVATADGIIICRPWVKPSAFVSGASRLVAIGRAGIGYDKIDLGACTANDVVVFNSPDGLTRSTASAAMILMLALARRLPQQMKLVREFHWDRQNQTTGDDLEGRVLGIVGLGKTALELVRYLAPFRMKSIAYSPRADKAVAERAGVKLVGSMEEVFREADYVSLHTRLTPATRGQVTERLLRLMKSTAFFINVARGELVDEHALIQCLEEKSIAGAGLDVFDEEPLPLSSPLLKLDNVILTPHWLCSTHGAGRATMAAVLEGMMQISRGEIPENILNPHVLGRAGFRAKLGKFA